MKKYFLLQQKRAFKLFPYVLTVAFVLLLGVIIALNGMLSGNANKEENQKVNVGVTGDMENSLLRLGMGAFQTLDDTQYSIELVEYKGEEAAATALKKGDVAAYIVVPEEFVEEALHGNVEPIKFVTTVESSDIITLFKTEMVSIITRMVIDCQKGTYGIGDALIAADSRNLVGEAESEISLEYFELVLKRGEVLEVEELGLANSLSTTNYYICSLLIVFIMIMGLPFASLYCNRDTALAALLNSKGKTSFKMLCGEYLAHLISLISILLVIFLGFLIYSSTADTPLFKDSYGCPFITLLPVLMMFAAFNLFVFEIAANIISGLLSHFFLSISLCFISGCFFPLYSFPSSLQKVAQILPVCVAREQISTFFTGESGLIPTLMLLGFAGLFFAACLFAKRIKLLSGKGVTV